VLLGSSVAAFATDARADGSFQFTTAMTGAWLRQTPGLTVDSFSTGARAAQGGKLVSRSGPGIGLLGFVVDSNVVVDQRWNVPFLGFGLSWAAGSYDTRVLGLDGSIAKLDPSSAFRFDVLLPGLGMQGKLRRWSWAATVRSGFSYLKMDGAVAAGPSWESLHLAKGTPLVQAEIEGCRRMDPEERICVQIAPRVWEHEFMNGLMISLRAEFGR
jgi:hypothetical protein